jgi:hypothetical protein
MRIIILLRRLHLVVSTILLILCVLFVSIGRAVVPAPDGGYTGGNTAEGTQALQSLTTGTFNTALGFQALFHDTTGSFNNAAGARAMYTNTTGGFNTATGPNALFSNTTGNFNVGTDFKALYSSTTGTSVVARLKEQEAEIQKVNAQLELKAAAPHTVASSQP